MRYEFLFSETLTSYKLPWSSKTCLPQVIFSRAAFTLQRLHSDPAHSRQFFENESQLHANRYVECITCIQRNWLVERKSLTHWKRVFPLSFKLMGKTLLTQMHLNAKARLPWKQPRICHREKNLKFSYYPINKEFVFKISYACISNTSVGAMFYWLTFLAKIETERNGKPPVLIDIRLLVSGKPPSL